jgi:hypothetical protein
VKTLEPGEYTQILVEMKLVAQVVLGMNLEGFLSRVETAQAIAPLIDPTLYIKKGEAMAIDARVARAMVELKKVLEEIKRESGS